MITKAQYNEVRAQGLGYFQKAGIAITAEEVERLEVADFGLGDIWNVGLVVLTYVNTNRVCAKELICLPNQLCPEHRHPTVKGQPLDCHAPGQAGKEETFRCRWGTFYLYVPGEPTANPKANPPAARRPWLACWHEVILKPGDQYTLPPNTKHWFQAGPEGAVVSEFSTHSDDESDVFSDPNVKRIPVIAE